METQELCQEWVKYLEEDIQTWTHIQGILFDHFNDEAKKPSFKKAVKMHFLDTKPDYIETLNLGNNDLSKIKLITGSVHKNKDEQVINLEFFGKNLTVSKKVRSISNDDEPPYSDDDDNYSPTKHEVRMSMLFDGLSNDQSEICKELQMQRTFTFSDNTPKLLESNKSKQDESNLIFL